MEGEGMGREGRRWGGGTRMELRGDEVGEEVGLGWKGAGMDYPAICQILD